MKYLEFLLNKEEITKHKQEILDEMSIGDFIPSHFDDCGFRNIEKYMVKLGCSSIDELCVYINHENYEIDTGYNDIEVYQEFALFRKNDYQNLVDQASLQTDKVAIGTIDAIGVFYLDNTFCLRDQIEEGKITLEVRVADEETNIKVLNTKLHWH